MAGKKHRFRLKVRCAPADLLLALKSVCEDSRNRDAKATFEFDWLKRRAAISAATACAAEELAERVQVLAERRGGRGLLLPGKRIDEGDGRHTLPMGILLQSADVYAEMIRDAMGELGIPVALGEDGEGFAVGVNPVARAMDYLSLVRMFPLPEYLELVDEGLE